MGCPDDEICRLCPASESDDVCLDTERELMDRLARAEERALDLFEAIQHHASRTRMFDRHDEIDDVLYERAGIDDPGVRRDFRIAKGRDDE